MGLKYWNKLIDLYFLNKNGIVIAALKCPRLGQKPSIELVGAMYASEIISEFDITVKNFYLGSIASSAKRVRVKAGYENSMSIGFEGDISYICPKTPAPEGSCIIHCNTTSCIEWLPTPVTLNLEAGYTLKTALMQICKAMKFKPPILSPIAMLLTSKDSFQFQGSCQQALSRLKECFEEIEITNSGDLIKAYKEGEKGTQIIHKIECLSSPPIIEAGYEGSGTALTITAPWNPLLKLHDIVTFSLSYYQSTQMLKNFTKPDVMLSIKNLQFHFSTVGNTNQMTIWGISV